MFAGEVLLVEFEGRGGTGGGGDGAWNCPKPVLKPVGSFEVVSKTSNIAPRIVLTYVAAGCQRKVDSQTDSAYPFLQVEIQWLASS